MMYTSIINLIFNQEARDPDKIMPMSSRKAMVRLER